MGARRQRERLSRRWWAARVLLLESTHQRPDRRLLGIEQLGHAGTHCRGVRLLREPPRPGPRTRVGLVSAPGLEVLRGPPAPAFSTAQACSRPARAAALAARPFSPSLVR